MSNGHDPKLSGTKICSKCKVSKTVVHFAVDRQNKDGLQSWCRECYSEGNDRKRWDGRVKPPSAEGRKKRGKAHGYQTPWP